MKYEYRNWFKTDVLEKTVSTFNVFLFPSFYQVWLIDSVNISDKKICQALHFPPDWVFI